MSVEFEDFSIKVTEALEDACLQLLNEASFEIQSQAQRNSRVDSGQLKGSWTFVVDEGAMESKIGSPLENAIWEEFGTGEHALGGDGRKGGWYYEDAGGEWHFTKGKKPHRTLYKAFEKAKPKIIKRAKQIFGERMN